MRLLRAGADLHAPIPAKGRTVLEDAVLRGSVRSLQRMIDEGIDPLAPSPGIDPTGSTYGATLLDRLLGLRAGQFPGGGFSPDMSSPDESLSDATQACLVLLETHGLRHTLDAMAAVPFPASEASSPRRRL